MLAVLRRQNLLRICRGNCCHLVRIQNTGLHETDSTVVAYISVVINSIIQSQTAVQHFHTEVPLISQIVNRINKADIAIAFIKAVTFLAHSRNHPGMPVMTVHDFREVVQLIAHFNDSLLEISKAFPVINMSIHFFTLKVSLVLNKIEFYILAHG